MSARETALLALLAAVGAAVAVPPLAPGLPRPQPLVLRNENAPQKLDAAGAVCLFDGEVVEETPILSPLSYIVRWRADIEIHAKGATAAARAATLDAMLTAICTALAANRTLGGAVEWLDLAAAQFDTTGGEGGADIAAALLPVEMQWTVAGSPNA